MKAIIFAAGKSTRTYPLTINKPKPLLEVMNIPILEHNLKQLKGIIDEAIIIVGFNSEMIIEKIGDSFENISIEYITQKVQDGTGGALILASEYVKGKFIVMNGDDLYSRKDIEKCLKHKYCVLGKEVSDIYRFGELVIKGDYVTEIIEKPKKNNGIANTGLYVFDDSVFKINIRKSVRGEYEITDFIKNLEKVNFEVVTDFWLPITYPWNLIEANELFMPKITKQIDGTVEKGATLKGEVSIGEGTVVKAGSYIEGPVIIGKNCVIGPNCYIRAFSVIGDGSKIGNAVEVKNSIIGKNTSIGHLSYVGDSVIGDNVNFGAGTITANLRHDDLTISSPVKGDMVDSRRRKLGAVIGDNVHTGINTSIYPGRKIWPNKTTIPGEIIKKDIE